MHVVCGPQDSTSAGKKKQKKKANKQKWAHEIVCTDMIDTADSICSATSLLLQNGVKTVLACATHGVLSGDAVDKIDASPLTEVILTDSIPILRRDAVKRSSKITVLSVAPLIGEALRRIHNEESVSSLYRYE